MSDAYATTSMAFTDNNIVSLFILENVSLFFRYLGISSKFMLTILYYYQSVRLYIYIYRHTW